MKASKLREMTKEEVQQHVDEARKELFNLRIRQSAGPIEQPLRVRSLRRDVARALSVLKQRA